MKLGIITTTYNREKLLQRLFESLLRQTDQDFIWVVVDDGSTDNTHKYIQNLRSPFEIRYYSKENGGKAKALNFAFQNNLDLDLFAVVDSDDYLLENGVSTLREYALKYLDDPEVGGLFFRYQYEDGQLLGENKRTFADDEKLSRIDHDIKYDKVDGCIAYFNKAIQKYRYPEFKGEKYVGPVVIQMMMSDEFKIVFSNEVIGVAEYQEGGLTSSGRKLRIKSPNSMIVYCHYMQEPQFDKLTQIKYGIMANAYQEFTEINTPELKYLRIPIMLKPFGKLLAWIWKIRYL